MRKKITHYILPVGLYAMVIVLTFGSTLFPPAGVMIFGDDIHHQYYFYREFFNNFLAQGIFPWWNPYNFSGTPFIADPIVNIWYPPTWLFVFLPLNVAYSWHLALHIVFAMTGMYVLSSKFKVQSSKLAAWVAGLIFGLSGFFMARTWAGHVDVVAAASWMPWVVFAIWQQRVVLAGAVLAMQILAGYHTMAFFTMEVVGLMTVFFCFQKRSIVPALRVFLVFLIAIGLAAIQLVPEMEFLRQSIRSYSLPYSWASYGSLTWESLKQLFNPFFFGDQLTYHGPPPNFIEHSAFVGRIGLGLAVVALFRVRKYALFALVAVLGLWISLGPNAPIDLQKILWTLVPIYHSLRIPPRHLILFVFGAAALASFGLQQVKIRAFQVIIAALVVVEMVGFGRHFIELRPIPEARQDKELIAILKKDTQPYRLLQNFGVWVPPRDSLDFDAAMSRRIFSATGYDVSILKSYYEFIDAAAGNKESSILAQDVQVPYFNRYTEALDFLNIKYLMVPRHYDPFVGMKLLREDPVRDYRLYENKTVLPRFYFPDHSAPTISKYTPNEIILSSNYPSDATLMSSEVYYPGWEATIDGKKTEIIKGNNAFRTLFVPAGKHSIVYVYIPTIFYISAGISVFTLTILLLIVLRKRKP